MKWLFKTEQGSISGSGRAYNLSRKICIVSLRLVPKKEVILFLPYLGVQSKIITKQLKACINGFYGCIDLRIIFQMSHRIKSFFFFFPTKIGSTVPKGQKLYTRLVVGTARISTLEKQNAEKLNIGGVGVAQG